jgi:hypothetical protein
MLTLQKDVGNVQRNLYITFDWPHAFVQMANLLE